ncbi:MAG: proton-translocating transhydrogenase family protein [Terriglobia bacterium]
MALWRDRAPGQVGVVLGFAAVASAISNIVGTYLVTDRMLAIFNRGAAVGGWNRITAN